MPPSAVGPLAAPSAGDVTALLRAVERGDERASNRLYETVYGELARIARAQLKRAHPSETLSTAALVNEAYLKLAGRDWSPRDRFHFYALTAQAMRRVLLDHAKSRMRRKRGGGGAAVTIEGLELGVPERAEALLALDEAVAKLEGSDPELGRLVEWRFYAGLSVEEIAALLGVSDRTIKRQWRLARAFLFRELQAAGVGA